MSMLGVVRHVLENNLKAEIEIMALHEKLDQIRIGHLEEMLDRQRTQLQSILEAIKKSAGPNFLPG